MKAARVSFDSPSSESVILLFPQDWTEIQFQDYLHKTYALQGHLAFVHEFFCSLGVVREMDKPAIPLSEPVGSENGE